MTISPNYIDPFYSNRLLRFKVVILNSASIIKYFLRLSWLKTGLIVALNKDLGKLLIMTEGLKKVTAELTSAEAKEQYSMSENSLKKFKRIYVTLDSVDFFSHNQTKLFAEEILCNFYELESNLRHLTYSDSPILSTDNELRQFSSYISRKSVIAN